MRLNKLAGQDLKFNIQNLKLTSMSEPESSSETSSSQGVASSSGGGKNLVSSDEKTSSVISDIHISSKRPIIPVLDLSPNASPSSSFKRQSEVQMLQVPQKEITKQPSSNPNGPGRNPALQGRMSSMLLKVLKTENELELEKQASQYVTGPLEKKWENFGVPEADDDDQLIDVEKQLSRKKLLQIKETVNAQMHEVIKDKRGWAYYEKHQPDYASFQIEVKKVIMELIGPTVTENTKNANEIESVKKMQQKLAKNMQELEFVYKRVVKNSAAQQDALTDLETRSKALRITEERLREQVKQCEQIKDQLSEKFKLLRDDRAFFISRIDHTDNEVEQYRKDIRQIHEQMNKQILAKVMEVQAMALAGQRSVEEQKERNDALNLKFDLTIEGDFRDQQIKMAKLQEKNIEYQELINILDRSIVTQINWDEKNRHYDHQINILAAAFNQVRSEFNQVQRDIKEKIPLDVQLQIDNTIKAVFGDRKKYMRALQKYSYSFYDQIEEKDPDTMAQLAAIRRKATIKSPLIPQDSEDGDSDKSEDRLQKNLANLQKQGKLKLGGVAEGAVNQEEVIDLMQKHNEQQFEKVKAIYVDMLPIRRQAKYAEKANEFVSLPSSKLRVLDSKQVASLNLSAFKHLAVEKERRESLSRISASRQSGSISQTGSKKSVVINISRNESIPQRTSSLRPKTKNETQITLPKLELEQEVKIQEKKKWEAALVQLDKTEINTIFNKLNTLQKFKIAKALNAELEKRMHLLDSSKMLKVKNKTIENAIADYQNENTFQMTPIQISAVVTVLCLKNVLDENGVKIETDFIDKKLELISQMIELENEGSDENSSQESRHRRHNFGLKPPAIETQLATDRSAQRRSKTMQPEVIISKRHESSQSQLENNPNNDLGDLKSVDSEDQSNSSESISGPVSIKNKPPTLKLDLKSPQQERSRSETPQKSVSLSQKSNLQEQAQKIIQPLAILKSPQVTETAKRVQTMPQRVRASPSRNQSVPPLSYGEDSYDYPEGSVSLDSNIGTQYKVLDKDFEVPPPQANVPSTTEQILVRMKQQIDELDHKLKDRTNEIRELKNYVKRFEDSIISELEKNFKQVYLKMDYNVADLKDQLHKRMKLVGNKMVTNKQEVTANKEQAEMDKIATQKRVKVVGRVLNERLDEVNRDHDLLRFKYDLLIHQNNYFSKLAEQMITIVEVNSCLLTQDEKDRESICLLGSKGVKNLKEQHVNNHIKRLQQHIEEQSDDKSGSGPQVLRPQTGVSHMSQKSHPLSIKSNQTRQSKIDGEENPVVQVDKRCITCSDDRGQLIQLFKIACLSYFPSKVEYKAKKYDKKSLISKQNEFVNELRSILEKSGTNPFFDGLQPSAVHGGVKVRQKHRVTDEDEASEDFEQETQINSEQKFGAIVSSEANSRQVLMSNINKPNSTYDSANRITSEAFQTSNNANPAQPGFANNAQQSNLRKHDQMVQKRQSPSIRVQSPKSNADTEPLTEEKSQTERNQINFGKKVQADQTQRPLKLQRVSFDQNEDQLKQFQQQQQVTAQKTQTSFRFNASHELLAYNQEQIQKLLPNPVTQGAPVDSKLMQIQKLKEKALMIQLSREVNKPNSFIVKARESKTPKSQPKIQEGDFFFSKEQYEQARDMARIKHEKETKIMLDTRENFTKRYQYEKLSHQPLSSALSNTQFSGSYNNELARYESKTIFRNAKREPSAERVPKNYSHLIENQSPSLPSLTRNMSAQQRHYKTSEELLLLNQPRQTVLQHIRGRNQRPISSMNEQTSQPFWRTARQGDGHAMVIVNQDRRKAGIQWSRTRQSSNTEQINKMLGGTENQSLANFSQQ